MEYIESITNKNLLELLKKKKFTEKTVWELKVALFIHLYRFNEEKDQWEVTISKDGDFDVVNIFTSLEEYYKCYDDENNVKAFEVKLNSFDHADVDYFVIDPKGINKTIPKSLAFHIMEDIAEREDNVDFNYRLHYNDFDNDRTKAYDCDILYQYLNKKSKITYIKNLFDYLEIVELYNLVFSYDSLDEYFKDDSFTIENNMCEIYKKEGYIVVFTEKSLFESEIKDKSKYFYYSKADMYIITEIVLELDYSGIILKTPENEFKLERHRLLKYFDDIINSYHLRDNFLNNVYKLEE